jgi:Flp pilus assembly protein TadD
MRMLDSDRISMSYFRQGVSCAAFLLMLPGCTEILTADEVATPVNLKEVIDFVRGRDWKRAGAAVDQALEKSPDNPQALYWKSYVLFQTGNYKQSSVFALRFLEGNPASGEARKVLGLDYFMQGQSALAEAELRRASDLSPLDADVRYYLGRIQFERQNLPAALQSLQSAVSLDPGSIRAFNHLGQTYEGLARFEDARAAYRKAIELDQPQAKHSEWPYFNLGVLSLKEGQSGEATRWLRKALVYKPSWPDATVQLAAALGASNEYQEAKRLLEELLAADPKNAQAHYQLARLLVRMHLPDEARRHFLLFADLRRP